MSLTADLGLAMELGITQKCIYSFADSGGTDVTTLCTFKIDARVPFARELMAHRLSVFV